MYDLSDTITAPAAPSLGENTIAKSVIRISGPKALILLDDIFDIKINKRCAKTKTVRLQKNICIDLTAYGFIAPNSYTGEDLAELHFFAPACLVELVLEKLLQNSRLAGPGEFTLRAYLNGRIDLAQAEAVAQIVSSSNTAQLAAAEKLLAGSLSQKISLIRNNILDILSLIEAGLDFSGEDIEFVSQKNAVKTIETIKDQLNDILNNSIRYEEMIDLPSVGLAGAPNAGKSSLLNTLLGRQRSIVSDTRATTRDVLTGTLSLEKNRIALFDCAGLSPASGQTSLLDNIAQQAAAEALKNADIVLFCIDMTKDDFSDDISVLNLIESKEIIYIAAKCDLDKQYKKSITRLNNAF
ncbi:MAG: 50S ribosome-binding GTPase, partial [Sedimentisphaerales bacterium]|nr:50S ribosome-binding GTPase [Sedimentisphaerales bacterium]